MSGRKNPKNRDRTNGRLFTCPLCNKEIEWNEYGICEECRKTINK